MKSLCKTLEKPPSESSARVLANLFPATARKRAFDPLCASANTESKRKKKAFKGRPKVISVVCLEGNSGIIPRGTVRERLKKNGHIKDVPFLKFLTHDEVQDLIKDTFSLESNFFFLKSHKNNSLCQAEKQQLDGAGVIDLAGKGALYLHLESSVSTSTPATSEALLQRADEVVAKLRVSSCGCFCNLLFCWCSGPYS